MGVSGLGLGLWLAKNDPALFEERLSSIWQRGQERWDKIVMTIFVVCWVAWYVLMALDAARYEFSRVPLWLQCAGAAGLLLSMYLNYLVFRENSFAAPVVKIQTERRQRAVTTGLYRYVRHPMYAAAALSFVGTALLLGSWLGLAMTPVLIVLLAIRAMKEEQTLIEKLDGYADYATRVRYRLIPGLW
jgi:protein-S-isoprenylcysteine O-methyltransferase Ste14